jgi:hypothetical protein
MKHEEIKSSLNEQLNSKIRELNDLQKKFDEFVTFQTEKFENEVSIKKESDRTYLNKIKEVIEFAENISQELEVAKKTNACLVIKNNKKKISYYLIIIDKFIIV